MELLIEFVLEFVLGALLELVVSLLGPIVHWVAKLVHRWLSLPMRTNSRKQPVASFMALSTLGVALGLFSLLVFDHRLSDSDVISTAALVLNPAAAAGLVGVARRVDPERRDDDPFFMTGRGAATFVFFFTVTRYYFLV